MKKEWFVFKKDHHEGPYSEKYIRREYRENRLKGSSLVWKEGLESWSPLKDQSCFQELFPKSNTIQKSEDESKEEGLPPPISSLEGASSPDKYVSNVVKEKKSASYPRLFSPLAIMAVLSLLGVSAYMISSLLKRSNLSIVLLNTSPDQKGRIENVLHSHVDVHLLDFTEDKNSLWVAYGRPLTGPASIYLKSRKNRILSEKSVEVFASHKMVVGFVIFSKFETLRGTSLVSGEYDYRIRLYPKGLFPSIGRFLRLHIFLEDMKWMDIFGDVITLEGILHYHVDNKDGFEEKLAVFNKKKHFQQKSLPLIEQLEKLKVFYAMMEKIKVFFDKHIKEAKEGKDFASLEDHYIQNISPLLQKITLDSQEKSMSLMDSQVIEAAEHLEIFENGKTVIEFMAYVIEKTTNVERYTNVMREKIVKEFERDYRNVLIQLNTALEKRKKKSEMFLQE